MTAALNGIIGHSVVMQELTTLVLKVAPYDCTVLVRGESGTGKELIARSIQKNSKRADGPFVTLNCGAAVASSSTQTARRRSRLARYPSGQHLADTC